MNTVDFLLGMAIANAAKEDIIENEDGSFEIILCRDNEKDEREDIENSIKLYQEISELFKEYETQEIASALTIALKDNMSKFYYELVADNNQTKEGAKKNVALLLETIKETVMENLEEIEK